MSSSCSRILGVACTPRMALLTLAVNGDVVATRIQRLEVAAQHEASAGLLATMDDIRRALSTLAPDAVAILKPEPTSRSTYDDLAPRIALETLMRIVAVQEEIDVEVVARATVRSRLGIDRSGKLSSHVASVVPEAVGNYWSQGRDIAALAAVARGRS